MSVLCGLNSRRGFALSHCLKIISFYIGAHTLGLGGREVNSLPQGYFPNQTFCGKGPIATRF